MEPVEFAIGRVLDGHKHTFNGEWNCTCGVPGWPDYAGWLRHFTGEILHAIALESVRATEAGSALDFDESEAP